MINETISEEETPILGLEQIPPEEVYHKIGKYLPSDLSAFTKSDFKNRCEISPEYRKKCTILYFFAEGRDWHNPFFKFGDRKI